LEDVPSSAGCYIFKTQGTPIYVGKAKSLRKRLRDYLGRGPSGDPKTSAMLGGASTVEIILTANETEALLLEMTLIKRYQPKYNVALHGFPYIKITSELFPRIFVTREMPDDAAGKYLGPFTDATALRQTVNLANRAFKLRTCSFRLDVKAPRRPCLKYETGVCRGPCRPGTDPKAYREAVQNALKFITGKRAGVLAELERRMHEASARLAYEEAAVWRDVIRGLRRAGAVQAAVVKTTTDADAVACEVRGGHIYGVIVKVREGCVVDRLCLDARAPLGDPCEEFLLGYYGAGGEVPRRIYLAQTLGTAAPSLSATLTVLRGEEVTLSCPRRGEGAELIKIASENLAYFISVSEMRRQKRRGTLSSLRSAFGCKKTPDVWEMIDISHGAGTETVGVTVTMRNGRWDKSSYRRYRIRTAAAGDDLAAIAEVIKRRFRAGIGAKLPDVLVIDGGKGQLTAARKALDGVGLEGLPVAALAKDPDRIYVPNKDEPLVLEEQVFSLVCRLRDEAHRFAITYHRSLRRRRLQKSILDDIRGIGPVRKKALLKQLGSTEGIAAATVEELAAVEGMTITAARAVYDRLRREGARDG